MISSDGRGRRAGRRTSGLTLVRRKWSGQEVPSAASGAQLLPGQEVQHGVAVGEVADLGGRRWRPARGSSGRSRPPWPAAPPAGSGSLPGTTAPNGSATPCSVEELLRAVRMISSELASHSCAGGAPGGDAVAAEDHADRLRVLARGPPRCPGRAGTRGAATGTQTTRSPKHSAVSSSPSAAVASAIPESGCRWSTCGGVDQPVRSRCRSTAPRRPCRAGSSRTRRPSRPRARRPGRRRPAHAAGPAAAPPAPARCQRAQVAPGPLDPQQLHRLAGDRVGLGALGRGVAARVVGVARVGAQPVGPGDQLVDGRVRRSLVALLRCLGRPAMGL